MACLEVIGPSGERSIHFLQDKTSVGRSAHNHIVLSDPAVSRHHALFYQRDSDWIVEDLESRNGTFVDRQRIPHSVELTDGTRIRFGKCRAVFFREHGAKGRIDAFSGGLVDTAGFVSRLGQGSDSIAHEILLAREIQRFLLPRNTPSIGDYIVFGDSQPCYAVGGDFYDFHQRADGALALVIGDVARKGFASAMLGHYTQATIRTALDYESDLEKVTGKINRDLCLHSPPNQFVTAFVCLLDPRSGSIDYVNAGHCPPLLVRSDGSTEFLAGYNMLLGIDEHAPYAAGRARLMPGDTFCLYSDGVTECLDPDDDLFGEERFSRFLAGQRAADPNAIMHALEAELERFSRGSQPDDDVTVVLLRRSA